ncbi:5'-3' deoxyribonucleotidase [Caulobacter phage CcrBL9]|uniref:Uncharacterized protein n=1 Tax=Caulobacter phage CcrBL9 TaxID=2283270 RepID=A0A385EC05_9CAUD|nr:5'-3' deoxyribonucleotidase [Caulobacter phage CcrBL9]AXQ69313.1 hypothetical protein CcrBL9_gp289 [Caulobacter phage CcrBL9]
MQQITDSAPHLRGYGWAPGGYMSTCHSCEQTFIGDKRAISCHPCATRRYEKEHPETMTDDRRRVRQSFAVYLDQDGVVFDFDEGLRRLGFQPDPEYNKSSHAMNDEANLWKQGMYEVIKGTDFFARLPLMDGAVDLYAAVEDADPIFLTASPKFGSTEHDFLTHPFFLGAAYHKRRSVEEVLLPQVAKLRIQQLTGKEPKAAVPRVRIADDRFICTTSARKQEYMHRKHSPHQVLIDDRIANCEAWAAAGGIAILHTSARSSITIFERLVDRVLAGETLEAGVLRTDFPRSKQPKVDLAQVLG